MKGATSTEKWYLNKQPTHDCYCVYSLDADGKMNEVIGPFFVMGLEKARMLHMMLIGTDIVVEARKDAEQKLVSYETALDAMTTERDKWMQTAEARLGFTGATQREQLQAALDAALELLRRAPGELEHGTIDTAIDWTADRDALLAQAETAQGKTQVCSRCGVKFESSALFPCVWKGERADDHTF